MYLNTRTKLPHWVCRTLLVLACGYPAGFARADDMEEAKLKALYLVNIATFVRWNAPSPVVDLCIWSGSGVYPHLVQMPGIDIGGKRRLQLAVDPENLDECEIVYFDQSNQNFTDAHSGLLVVSDLGVQSDRIAAIQLFVRNLKLRFAIDRNQLVDKEFKISSKLLRLARQVD